MNGSQSASTTTGIPKEVDTLNTRAWELRESDRAAVQQLSSKAGELADRAGYTLGKIHSLIPMAFVAFREICYDKALEASLQALNMLETVPASIWRLRLYNLLGMIHSELGERAEGLGYFEKQSRLSKQLSDREMEALAQHDIALYHLEGAARQNLLETALTTFEALDSRTYKAIALLNLSEHFLSQQVYDVALTYAERALTAMPFGNAFDLQVTAFGLKTKCHSALKNEEEAFSAVQVALALAEAQAPQVLGEVYIALGTLYQAFLHPAEALGAFERALEFSRQNTIYTLQAHRLLAECYAETGDYAGAYDQQRRFQNLHDEVFKMEREQKVRALEVIYRTRSAQHEAELERARNTELRSHITQLEALNAQIRELSLRDSLTGLYNRRHFSEQLTRHFTQSLTDGPSLGLILLDIDNFKSINDAFGHAAGDTVLERVAKLLNAEVRDTDIVARYGGEEFAILLPQRDLGRTLKIAERIRTRVEVQRWKALGGSRNVTLSLGVAMSASCRDTDQLLHQADARLYEAKRQGRNRVCAGEPSESPVSRAR